MRAHLEHAPSTPANVADPQRGRGSPPVGGLDSLRSTPAGTRRRRQAARGQQSRRLDGWWLTLTAARD